MMKKSMSGLYGAGQLTNALSYQYKPGLMQSKVDDGKVAELNLRLNQILAKIKVKKSDAGVTPKGDLEKVSAN